MPLLLIWTYFSYKKKIPYLYCPPFKLFPFCRTWIDLLDFASVIFPVIFWLILNSKWWTWHGKDLPKAFLAMYLPQPLLTPAVCLHFSAGSLCPQPSSQWHSTWLSAGQSCFPLHCMIGMVSMMPAAEAFPCVHRGGESSTFCLSAQGNALQT